MKNFLQLIITASFLGYAFGSCSPEEQQLTLSPIAKLRFSSDTVLFDTVFTTIGSTTKRFAVYNDNKNAVNISTLRTLDTSSPFTLTVNGIRGNQFENLRLLGNDSMLVLVEVNINPQNEDLPFIVEDKIEIETNENMQSLDLVAWGQDANFINDSILSCVTTWTANRPYVIYNSVLIDSLCLLRIEPGTRIFSHFGSSIFVKGTIEVNGEADNRVLISNDRIDENFRNAPGQWEGIFFLEGSQANWIRYADIRNANYGIWLGTPDADTIPDLILDGVKVENMARSGILAFTSDLYVENTLVDNCAEYCIGNFAGGNYSYAHCTFSNLSTNFFRETPLFAVTDNLVLSDQSILLDRVSLTMVNSIFWGDFADEVLLNNEGGQEFRILTASNIIKTTQEVFNTNGNLINQNPMFINPLEYNFKLDSLSPAIDAGDNIGISRDLEGVSRDLAPDIGAFEWVSQNN